MPDQNRELRKVAIQKSLNEYKSSGETRTETIEYRGKKRNLEVITLLPSILLLNHDNSRLSAQLVDHPQRQLVETDPSSEAAQKVLASLLSSTANFKDLKEELKGLGQRNPGMVSRDGVLINGNTRLVALREIGASGIDVAVLPEDALPEDFLDIEMSLQMTQLTHQDYTFTNQLLLMKRYLDRGHTWKELAQKMGWMRNAEKKIEQSIRILHLINEIRSLYKGNFPYDYFDSKQQVLKDLDDEYQKLTFNGDLKSAEILKWSRISAIFLGVSKDQVRAMDENFFNDEVIKRLDTRPELSGLFKQKEHIKNLELEQLLGAPETGIDMKKFAGELINSVIKQDGVVLPELPEKYQEIATQVRLGAEGLIMEEKMKSYLTEPQEGLREIRLNLDKIAENIGEISSFKDFKPGDFEYELRKVQKSIADLVSKSKKYLET
jgi:hypothetical protein